MVHDAVSVFELSPPEKLQLVEDLWDDLAANPSDVPVTEWQKAELDRRAARLAANPGLTVQWDDVVARIRARHAR
jgi:putative addiction module component (TIGR02574 family)